MPFLCCPHPAWTASSLSRFHNLTTLEKYKYPYLCIDHLKMGLIRSGNTILTPVSDEKALTDYLWPIVSEMIKTVIENGQNLIIEGCYIPFEWSKDFGTEYLKNIKYYCLVMSNKYIMNHFGDIKKYASIPYTPFDRHIERVV